MRGAGPDVVLVGESGRENEVLQAAEDFSVRVYVDLPDGGTTVSRPRTFQKGQTWIFTFDPKEVAP